MNKETIMSVSRDYSGIWQPTSELRWIDGKAANNPKLAVKFQHDIGWGWPSSVVLQQKWISDTGIEEWRDIPIITNK